MEDNYELAMRAMAEQEQLDVPMCQHPGCQSAAIKCTVPSVDESPDGEEYYCSKHAPEHGFCSCCGCFIAGTPDDGESICDLCRDEIEIFEDIDSNDFWNEDD